MDKALHCLSSLQRMAAENCDEMHQRKQKIASAESNWQPVMTG